MVLHLVITRYFISYYRNYNRWDLEIMATGRIASFRNYVLGGTTLNWEFLSLETRLYYLFLYIFVLSSDYLDSNNFTFNVSTDYLDGITHLLKRLSTIWMESPFEVEVYYLCIWRVNNFSIGGFGRGCPNSDLVK